jgi:uncharacterized protein (DUF608 family)
MSQSRPWPVLTRYGAESLSHIALPLGGIGTGTISLGGRGDLRDWEIANRPAKGFAPPYSFFAIRVAGAGGEPVTRALEGPLPLEDYEGARGSAAPHHGLPRFRECAFEAAYPLGQVLLSDPDVPARVRLQAFNPLVPGDAEASGLPLAALRFIVTNTGSTPLDVSICGNVANFIGAGEQDENSLRRHNEFRRSGALRGLFLRAAGPDESAASRGTLALATTAAGVTWRTAWPQLSWGNTLLDFWDDFSSDGRLEERDEGDTTPVASLCAAVSIAPGASEEVTFLLAWHFPNRLTWTPRENTESCCGGAQCGEQGEANVIGNYYCTRFADAWAAAEYSARALPELEAQTLQFVNAFCGSDLPREVREAALYNLSTLRSTTCFRTADGRFYGWEGCDDRSGCCHGSCTHVWNYEQATAFLFGDLSRSMREVEFAHATHDNGLMSFRVNLPLERAREYEGAAADGQMGCLMKLYRDWQLCGDDEFLRALWPPAKKALEFCWIAGGWDADRDGVMEGCQHNTMDVEYFGPNPQMQSWYLGALRAGEEMAKHLGEDDFAAECRRLFERGRRWTDENLFNGEYYEQHIRPIADASQIAPGLRLAMGADDLADPDLQLGAGCLIDQLVGQYMAHVCGLGYLLEEEHVKATLHSLLRYNFREELWSHFNHLRSYALGDEAAMLMASYPRGRRPQRPFPYYNEVMTGFEYTAAAHMLYEGMEAEGLKLIRAVRARYDGRRRSPFDEAECGHHYARAMASWAAVLALTGFEYSGVTRTLRFAASRQPAQWFWSNGAAWGTLRQRPEANGIEVEVTVLHGALEVSRLELRDYGDVSWPATQRVTQGETARWLVSRRD